jgi:hypothetical protein
LSQDLENGGLVLQVGAVQAHVVEDGAQVPRAGPRQLEAGNLPPFPHKQFGQVAAAEPGDASDQR